MVVARRRGLPLALTAAVFGAVSAGAASAAPARQAPPAAVTCPRDLLTAYTGAVRGWTWGETLALHIHTDWDTDETVILPTGDPAPYFRLRGAAFRPEDWPLIASAPGQLRQGLRAAAWVCLDGRTPPLIDWHAPAR